VVPPGVTPMIRNKATASRLKNKAFKAGFINLKKNYSENFVNKKAMQFNSVKYNTYNTINGIIVALDKLIIYFYKVFNYIF
jgi:hypothetical protein